MALVLNDCTVVVDHVTLTTRAKQVDISITVDQLDGTTFGGNGWRDFEQGLKTGTIQITFQQGFDSGGVHQTLWPLFDSGVEFDVRIGPTSDTNSVTNPVLLAHCRIFEYHFLQGSVGEISENPVTFQMTDEPRLLYT